MISQGPMTLSEALDDGRPSDTTMSYYRVTFVIPYNDSDQSDIDLYKHSSDFEDDYRSEDNELDFKEEILLLEDSDSDSDDDSEAEEASNIEDLLNRLSIEPKPLSPTKISDLLTLPPPQLKSRSYYDNEIYIQALMLLQ